jgi:hypothetical protein
MVGTSMMLCPFPFQPLTLPRSALTELTTGMSDMFGVLMFYRVPAGDNNWATYTCKIFGAATHHIYQFLSFSNPHRNSMLGF